MSLSRDSREERKFKAYMRARRGLEKRLADIDWEEDVLIPAVAEIKAGRKRFEIGSAAEAFPMEVDNEGEAADEAEFSAVSPG